MDSVNVLRKAVKRAERVEDGTVVRFKYHGYMFGAVYISATDNWYVTGVGSLLGNVYAYSDFTDVLSKSEDVVVATAFELIF